MKQIKVILEYIIWLIIIVSIYFVHQTTLNEVGINTEKYRYSVKEMYFAFGIFSFLILIILQRFQKKQFDSVGMAFMFLTGIKFIISAIIVRPILIISNSDSSKEKNQFLIIFMIFLAIETVMTIRILHKK